MKTFRDILIQAQKEIDKLFKLEEKDFSDKPMTASEVQFRQRKNEAFLKRINELNK